MDIRHLKTFQTVAQLLSFTRAATKLGYAQSSVTAHIKALETALNKPLFVRLGSRITLTPAGERLLSYAPRILDLVDDAQRAVSNGDEPSGNLVIGTMESITSYRLPALLELFHYRYPRVRVSPRPSLCGETKQALRNGVFDLGFLVESETVHPGLDGVLLGQERLALIADPGHPLAGVPNLTKEDLRRCVLLSPESGCAYRDLFEEELREDEVESIPLLEFGTIEAIKRGVLAGLGIALMPWVTVSQELESDRLVELAWKAPFRVYTQLVWHEKKWISRELRLFIDETIRLSQEEAASSRSNPLPASTIRTSRAATLRTEASSTCTPPVSSTAPACATNALKATVPLGPAMPPAYGKHRPGNGRSRKLQRKPATPSAPLRPEVSALPSELSPGELNV